MAKTRKNKPDASCAFCGDYHLRQAYCIFGLFLSMLGLMWVSHDVGWISLNLPYGPMVTAIIGFAIIFSTLPSAD